MNAVRNGDLETMRAVLARHPDLVNAATNLDERLRPSDTQAMRLIHLAVAENQVEAARLLIGHGVALNVRNADGRLPLHDCFELGRDEFAGMLLAAGAEPDVCDNVQCCQKAEVGEVCIPQRGGMSAII